MSESICSVPCCDRKAEKRGWCNTHYQRWRSTGDPGELPAKRPGISYSLRSGYVRIWEPNHPLASKDGYVYAHRKVVFDAGIVVPDGYHVHHLDGDKLNNDLSNLIVESNSDHQVHHNQPGMTRKNQYGTWIIGAGVNRERERKKALLPDRFCDRCGSLINHLRTDAKFCGKSCQVATFKANH